MKNKRYFAKSVLWAVLLLNLSCVIFACFFPDTVRDFYLKILENKPKSDPRRSAILVDNYFVQLFREVLMDMGITEREQIRSTKDNQLEPTPIPKPDPKLLAEYLWALEELKAMGTPNHDYSEDKTEAITDEQLIERYIQESEKLKAVADPIYAYLKDQAWIQKRYGNVLDEDRWYREYDQPIFEAVKLAMKRVTGTDDYLEICENRIHDRTRAIKIIIVSPISSLYRGKGYSLSELYTFAIVYDNQSELLTGIPEYGMEVNGKFYGNFSHGFFTASPTEPIDIVSRPMTFPPIHDLDVMYDSFWEIVAIYSFKNDRARDLLFEIAIRPREKYDDYFLDLAAYYLSLLPSSGELLPRAKILLKEAIARVRENFPERAVRLLDKNGEVIDPWLWQSSTIYENRQYVRLPDDVLLLLRLARLIRALEFNEKIPVEDQERFDTVRREIAIDLFLLRATSSPVASIMRPRIPEISVTLRKDEKQFEIYFQEYKVPRIVYVFLWEDAGDPSPATLENPYWQERKAFWEHELAHPRLNYTDRQMEYIKEKVRENEKVKKN
jgi:hypothetical protein